MNVLRFFWFFGTDESARQRRLGPSKGALEGTGEGCRGVILGILTGPASTSTGGHWTRLRGKFTPAQR